jgi:hypothetical protein
MWSKRSPLLHFNILLTLILISFSYAPAASIIKYCQQEENLASIDGKQGDTLTAVQDYAFVTPIVK